MSHSRRLRRTARAVGLPGRVPSREARMVSTSPHVASLPSGAWHISDYAAAALARTQPVVSDAVHAATGAHFRLLNVPDGPILGISPEDAAARELVIAYWDDPS